MVASLAGATGYDGPRMSGWGGGRIPKCYCIWWRMTVCWSSWVRITSICRNKALCVVVSVWNKCTMAPNSMADMVMDMARNKASWISKHEESKSWRAAKPLPNQSSEQGRESEKESNIQKFCNSSFNLTKISQACKMAKKIACCRTESKQSWRNFTSPFLPCKIFASHF